MQLVECFKDQFSANVKERGERYYRQNHVTDVIREGFSIRAEVIGTEDDYKVEVDCRNIEDQKINVSCTCPHFVDGNFCKHLWATFLAIDAQQEVKPVNAPGRNALTLQHSYDEDWDAPDFTSSIVRRLIDNIPVPDWEMHLADIKQAARAYDSDGKHSLDKDREFWFIVDITDSVDDSVLVICTWIRERKQNGDFGKLKPFSFRDAGELELDDQRTVNAINLTMLRNAPQWRYSYDPRTGSFVVDRAIAATVLPGLAKTGRLVWQLDANSNLESATPLQWSDDIANFELSIDDDPEAKHWEIKGQIRLGVHDFSTEQVVFSSEDGIAIADRRIFQLECTEAELSWQYKLLAVGSIRVPYDGRTDLQQALSGLPRHTREDIPEALKVEELLGEPIGRIKVKQPKPTERQVQADVYFQYAEGVEISLKESASSFFFDDRIIHRNLDAERVLIKHLKQFRVEEARPSWDTRVLSDVEFPHTKFDGLVRSLTEQGWIVEAEGKRVRSPGSFNLSIQSGVDWFELAGQVKFDDLTADLPQVLQALRRKQNVIRLDDGSEGILPDEWLQKYGQLADIGSLEDDKLIFQQSQAILLDALLSEQELVTADRGFEKFRDKLNAFDGVKPARTPRGFKGKLREYQKEGLGWLHFLRDFGFGGCLADDMGLGKTIQVLALLQSRKNRQLSDGEARKPTLIVVPKSLIFNWMDEAERFTPKLRFLNYTGTKRKGLFEELESCDVVLTTYGTLRRDIVKLREIDFDYAILDESQAIKNHNSQASKACRLVKSDHRLAMTGTPVENHLGELWALFEFLNPSMLGGASAFQTLVRGLENDDDEQSAKMLATGLRPFILRRTKEQVLHDLPEKNEQTLYCEMETSERKEYEKLRDYYRANLANTVKKQGIKKSKIHVLEALLRLRQAACHPALLDPDRSHVASAKLTMLLEHVTEITERGHKALVFSQFTSLLSIVKDHLDDTNIVYEYLDGKTRKRKERVDRFQNDENCNLFLISLKAGGHGLNLTAADYVFILDPWWNPAVEAQAIDRAHRMGQTRKVFAYRIICKDTVEDKIVELQKKKRDLADAIISADNSVLRSLTADDLDLLLS